MTFSKKKIKATTVKFLFKSAAKSSSIIYNLVRKTYPKFVTLRLFFKFRKKFKILKKIGKIRMYSEKSRNSFELKKGYDTGYLLSNISLTNSPLIMQNKCFWHL